ncbi:MAG: hypothetical protein IJQ86_08255 [Spirochaetia bacterium]|nr:hypothetical protein [Spirochaetia bacterium]
MSDLGLYLLYGTVCVMFGYVASKFFGYAFNIYKSLKKGRFLFDPKNKPVSEKEIKKCISFNKMVKYRYALTGVLCLIVPAALFMNMFNPFISIAYSLCVGECLKIIAGMVTRFVMMFTSKYHVAEATEPKDVDLNK